MLKFCSKLDNNFICYDGNEVYEDILKLGKYIELNGNNNLDHDFRLWNHKKKKKYRLEETEFAIINSINDDKLTLLTKKFINKYNFLNFWFNDLQYDFHTNELFSYSNIFANHTVDEITQMFCHIVYILQLITFKLNKPNITLIKTKNYYIDFYTNNTETFKKKTIPLVFNIINNCFFNGVNYYIDNNGDIVYFTQYLSSIVFFELYPVLRQMSGKGCKTSNIKSCEVCGCLFFSTRDDHKICGSNYCLAKKDSEYSTNSQKKKKNDLKKG